MNKFLALIVTLALGFTERALAAWAEFGGQSAVAALAATDASALQYRVMRFTGGGAKPTFNIASHNLGSSNVGLAAGVLQTNPSSGNEGTIAFGGLSKAVAGAATTANALLTHDGSGYVIDAVSGSIVIGRAYEAATAAGEIISVELMRPVRWGSVA